MSASICVPRKSPLLKQVNKTLAGPGLKHVILIAANQLSASQKPQIQNGVVIPGNTPAAALPTPFCPWLYATASAVLPRFPVLQLQPSANFPQHSS